MNELISLDNGLYVSSYIVVKNIVKQLLSTIGERGISYDLFIGGIDDKKISIQDNKIILSESNDYNYHTGVYKDWRSSVYSEESEDVKKFDTCITLKQIYHLL